MNIKLEGPVLAELEYMVKLFHDNGAPVAPETVESLVSYVLMCVADGSRRPGSWERQLLQMMGLVAECQEHYAYRASYGEPEGSPS